MVLECPWKILINNLICNCLRGYTELMPEMYFFVSIVLEPTLCFLLILSYMFWKQVGLDRRVEIWLNWYNSFLYSGNKKNWLRERTTHWKTCPVLQQSSFLGICRLWRQESRAGFLQWVRVLHEDPTWRESWEDRPMFVSAALCSAFEVFSIVFLLFICCYFICYVVEVFGNWLNCESRITGC